MNDSQIDIFHLTQAHYMNLAYGLLAMCITYKMAFIICQIPKGVKYSYSLLRLCAATVATLISAKAYFRFQGGDPATWIDLLREASWCGFLFMAMLVLQKLFRSQERFF
jgi:hypothetical protein